MARGVLKVKIIGDERDLSSALKRAHGQVSSFGSKVGTTLKFGLLGAGGAAVAGLGAIVKTGISEFSDYQKGLAQANAVIKSTGGVAGVTAKHIEDVASALQAQTGATDDSVVATQNLLLTFTGIQNKVGKGNDIFDQATKSVLDMSQALGQDTKSSAIQLGKALNDPIKGITALRRVGVSFTADQIKQIKALVQSGHTMQAQKLILGELNKEFGGSAKAFGDTLPGKLQKAKRAFEDVSQSIVTAFVPAFTSIVTGAQKFITNIGPKIGDAIEAIKDGFKGTAGGEENIFTRIGEAARQFIDTLRSDVMPFVLGALRTGFAAFVKIVKALIPPFLQIVHFAVSTLLPILKGIWTVVLIVVKAFAELIKRLSGPLQSAFRSINKAFEDHRKQIDTVIHFIQGLVRIIASVLVPVLSVVLGTAFRVAGKIIAVFITIIAGIITAFTNVKTAVTGAIDFLKRVVVTGIQFIMNIFLTMAGFIVHAAATAFGWIPGLGGKLKAADKAFQDFRVKVNKELDKIKNPQKYVSVVLKTDPAVQKLLAAKPGTVLTIADLGHGLAEGGSASRGWHVVGEKGPELAYFGGGGYVLTRKDVAAMQNAQPSGGDGSRYEINVHYPTPEPLAVALPAARRRLQLMLGT